MSILVKSTIGEYIMYSKGADSSLLPLTKFKSQKEKDETVDTINKFATRGFRTMVFGRKVMTRNEYLSFKSAMDGLQYISSTEGLNKVYARFENNLEFLGSTCVIDEM